MRIEKITRLPRRAFVAAAVLTAAPLLALSPGNAGAEYGLIVSVTGEPKHTVVTVTSAGDQTGDTEAKQLRRETRKDLVAGN